MWWARQDLAPIETKGILETETAATSDVSRYLSQPKVSEPIRVERGAEVSRETADGYFGFVAQLNPDWRVVACRDRVQWILQRRGSPEKPRRDDWRGRSYCRTRDALIRCTREYAPIDQAAVAILASLPERIETPDAHRHPEFSAPHPVEAP